MAEKACWLLVCYFMLLPMFTPFLMFGKEWIAGEEPYLVDVFSGIALPARSAQKGSSSFAGAIDGEFVVEDGVTLGFRCYPHESQSASTPILVAFHGNAGSVTDHDYDYQIWHHFGVSLIAVDFRGYGWGKPSGVVKLSTIPNDARAFANSFAQVLSTCSLPPTAPVLSFGFSIGSVASVAFASELQSVKGLILHGGIASFLDLPMAKSFGSLFDPYHKVPDPYNNSQLLSTLTNTDVLLFHGDQDAISPKEQGERLFEAANTCKARELVILPEAGHNSIGPQGKLLYWPNIEQFIKRAQTNELVEQNKK